jgi:chromosome segregation ATPase
MREQLDAVRERVKRVLVDEFDESADGDNSDLLHALERRLQTFTAERRVLTDALRIRAALRIGPATSLGGHIAELERQRDTAHKELDKSKAQAAELEQERNCARRFAETNAAAAQEAAEWERWARTMHRLVSDIASTAAPPADVRGLLEEALLVSVDHKPTLRKIELMRIEKKLMRAVLPLTKVFDPSFRNVFIMTQFCSRVLNLGGNAPNQPLKDYQ